MNSDYLQATQSFIGHLIGTAKAQQTIDSYKTDLKTFEGFMQSRFPKSKTWFSQLEPELLTAFSEYLDKEKVKTNTKRRKLLTIQKFLRYLAGRNKVEKELGNRFPTPHKVEKTPKTIDLPKLLEGIKALPADTHLMARNQLILWVLAETGCLVSELSHVRFEDVSSQGHPMILIRGKTERLLPISEGLRLAIFDHQKWSMSNPYLFRGFSKYGPLPERMSDRAIELIVKAYRGFFKIPALTPRLFRRSIVMHWFEQGKEQNEIQALLGLRSAYAFRVYEPLFKKSEA